MYAHLWLVTVLCLRVLQGDLEDKSADTTTALLDHIRNHDEKLLGGCDKVLGHTKFSCTGPMFLEGCGLFAVSGHGYIKMFVFL